MPKINNNQNELKLLDYNSFNLETKGFEKLFSSIYFLLGKLDGLVSGTLNQEILLAPILIMEAVKSSNIENINSTILNQLEVSVKGRHTIVAEQRLVANYKDALLAGFEYQKKNQRFDLELILLVSKTLLPNQFGVRNLEPVVIANSISGEILYTPPVGKNKILKYLDNWLFWANKEDDLDILIKVAILHCQFEAIHPFLDGNGRTGRVLIILFLIYKKVLSYPCLFISDYILKTRTQYYLALQEGQKNENFQTIVKYLSQAILEKTQFSLNLIQQKQDLEKYYSEQIQKLLPNLYSQKLIEYLFTNPFYSIFSIQDYLQISRNTASKYLHSMLEADLIKVQSGRKNKLFYNPAFLKLVS